MNKAKLKTYAPQARRDFIQMIRQRADLLGLTKSQITPARIEGDFSIIEGKPYQNKNYANLHKKLTERIKIEGLEPLIERVAYSWFNRFAALRFMEVNNLLSHGFRVLSNREAGKNEPEILTHAAEIELPGLNKNKVLELKLAGNKDAELYRLLLVAQCNELNRAMPFLFEKINDETEILLPDNLLHSDSVIRKMVAAIDEEDWAEVEVIGWLYQFYISEKKDEVIGKTVKSEDIPAATQLFTPNWIVKYMTQNSLGRLWIEANPHSQLAQNMEFYIKPADENKSASSSSSINPEEIKVLDPACGSGHILVEAYELLKAIYTERGYSSRDIPLLILEKNLFGLDIDERAAQMASFALLMKARRDDRRIFERLAEAQIQNPKSKVPNVMTVPDSSHLPNTAREIAEMFFSREAQSNTAGVPIRGNSFLFDEMQVQRSLVMSDTSAVASGSGSGVTEQNVKDLLSLFEQGKTLGSLIRIPHGFGAVVDKLGKSVETKLIEGNQFEKIAAQELEPFVRTAKTLATKYDCVIANPPYMGGKGMNGELKAVAAKNFPDSKSDLFAMFIERGFELLKKDGFNSMVTMQSWMFLSSYEKLRENLLNKHTLTTLLQLPYDGKGPTAMGISFGISVFVAANQRINHYKASFSCSRYFELDEDGKPFAFPTKNERLCNTDVDNFKKITGSPIAYWVSDKMRSVFEKGTALSEIGKGTQGIATTNNDLFVRFWYEVSLNKIGFSVHKNDSKSISAFRWFPYNKGGEFRKWYGNRMHLINWQNQGKDIHDYLELPLSFKGAPVRGKDYQFLESITWSFVSSATFGVRYSPVGSCFDVGGSSYFVDSKKIFSITGFLCSRVAFDLMKIFNPTLNFQVGNVSDLPYLVNDIAKSNSIAEEAIEIARADWDSFETSWDFARMQIVDCGLHKENHSVEECWQSWKNLCDERIRRMQELETENNCLFIEAYGLEDELSPEVPLEQITLARPDAEKDMRRLLSYFIGCLMGRYSLDEEGLIYADASNKGFDTSRYQTFPADDDGIVPVTDMEWFPQEAARQFESFVKTVWGEANLHSNLRWIAEQLGGKASETPTETVRRYFSGSFFKDHLQTYKKRPIYWLFSSGKQKAFEALVYLHRYSESTLPRMRHEYVLPLMSKLEAQIETYAGKADSYGVRTGGMIDSTDSTSEKNKLRKQLEVLQKKQVELIAFDEKLRHYSDLRISLDLDDGVKVNYGKFGDLLAEVKQVATTKE